MPRAKTSAKKTDAQRRAANKYQYKTSTVIGCKLDRETAERYKTHCAEHGSTPNAEIKSFILSQLGEQPSN